MTGRSLHDALLRLLTSAEARARLDVPPGPDGRLDGLLGTEEAAVLRRADRTRLHRLARFMGRHFYRERIVRLFAASRALARARGNDPLDLLGTPAFDALLETAEVGAAATAERVAALVEPQLLEAVGGLAYGRDLVAYEGALFRTEAGPRRWGDGAGAPPEAPRRSAHARLLSLEWDVTGLVAAVRRGDPELPVPPRAPTRLLIALSPAGRVMAVRASNAVERLLAALDGVRSAAEIARELALGESDVARGLGQLAEVGAVDWQAPAATA